MNLHDQLSENARACPDAPAVLQAGRVATYAEIDGQSTAVARLLVRRGVHPGDRVALFLDNSIGFVVAYFGILKAGGVVVALNAQVVQRELAFLLSDCTPKVCITDAAHVRTALAAISQPSVSPALLTLDTDACREELRIAAAAETVLPSATADDLAAIIYTSGTTGKPKGVMLSHGNITANAASIITYLRLTAADRIMVVLPFYYSYGMSLLTTHLMVGGSLVLDNRFVYPNSILDTMVREAVTGFAGVPSHYAILLRKSAFRDYRFPHLRYVTQAGGPMSPAMIREFTALVPHTEFYVMYGQTEATARLSYLDPAVLAVKTGSVGKGIPGVELTVMTDQGVPAKPGEIGEIVARGRNIMMGYWNAPEETRQVLRDGALYTGDLATVDGDGFLSIVSRKKDMIKSGANRISPREIEDVVCQLPGVLESAAIGVPDEILGESITLFLVRTDGAALSEQDVMVFCRQNLALYKNPKRIVFVPSLPKTASGKVKREELRTRT